MKRHIWPLTIASTGALLGLLSLTQPLLGQLSADLSKPVQGTLIDLGDKGPTPEDAGIRAHTNVKLFVPIGTAQPFGSASPSTLAETPASLACIYQLVSGNPAGCPITNSFINPSGGYGSIIIVDACDYPTAESDLDTFSSFYYFPNKPKFYRYYANGTPTCTPQELKSWVLEQALDIEWAYAMAPNAQIVLIQAKSPLVTDMLQAEDFARSFFSIAFCAPGYFCTGPGEISNSWVTGEYATETKDDVHFAPPQPVCPPLLFCPTEPMVNFAASGDQPSVFWPSASPWVVSAGGTTINRDSSGNFTGETSWYTGSDGAGGGPSLYEPTPIWQLPLNSLLKGKRGTPDLSMEANPASGVGVYVTSSPYHGWVGLVGGTSLASPLLAGIVNSANRFLNGQGENLLLYSELPPYANYSIYFRDISNPSNMCGPGGIYHALIGWDFCTGIGTPLTLTGK
jgi:kumamolisin